MKKLLIVAMGIFYYIYIAPFISWWAFVIQFINGEFELGQFIAIWVWPVCMFMDTERTLGLVNKAYEDEASGNN